jgi:NlpC/P60 family putative phage cell wall peptidase
MPTRAQVVECARTWIGTKWKHQQRLKGHACDCAGLVIGVGAEVFGIRAEVPPYSHTPHNGMLERIVGQYMRPKDLASIELGDVLLLTWAEDPHHMAIVSELDGEPALIHSYAQIKRVVEHRLDDRWRARIRACFEFPGIE